MPTCHVTDHRHRHRLQPAVGASAQRSSARTQKAHTAVEKRAPNRRAAPARSVPRRHVLLTSAETGGEISGVTNLAVSRNRLSVQGRRPFSRRVSHRPQAHGGGPEPAAKVLRLGGGCPVYLNWDPTGLFDGRSGSVQLNWRRRPCAGAVVPPRGAAVDPVGAGQAAAWPGGAFAVTQRGQGVAGHA